jgi:hypothetical protein
MVIQILYRKQGPWTSTFPLVLATTKMTTLFAFLNTDSQAGTQAPSNLLSPQRQKHHALGIIQLSSKP